MLDTLRPDHLALHGYPLPTAPYLSSLAERSAVFENAFSTSSCTAPAVASMFTGLYPTRHGVYEVLFAHRRLRRTAASLGKAVFPYRLNVLPTELATLPERLHELGYETFGFSSNPNVDQPMGFDRGFDHFHYAWEWADAPELLAGVRTKESELRMARPRFVYVHFMDPHAPYESRDGWLLESKADKSRLQRTLIRYDSEIGFLDHHLELLLELLDLRPETLLVIASDHGEELGERGGFGHEYGLHAELNNVLLMIHGPGLDIRPGIVDVNASLIDIVPTVMEAVGAPLDEEVDGSSLLPLVQGEAGSARAARSFQDRTLYAHRRRRSPDGGTREAWSVIRDRWKLIEDHGRGLPPGGERKLYDRASDPRESLDVLEANPAVADDLRASLDALKASGVRKSQLEAIELDGKRVEQLEALGYTDRGSAAAP